ncbi:MAG: cell division protein SepF [Eubacterium sp.]|nr:cell division protein SepF [Eubacterium sp.]
MGFLDKVKDIISETDDDDFDEYYDDFNSAPRSSRREREHELTPPPVINEREERAAERPSRRQKSDKVVNIHTTAQLQVVLVKPERYEEAAPIADHLNERRTVVLNLESTNRDVARRLLDFLSGVAYANNGQIKRVANSTYIITPYNVDVMGDLIDELENNGMFM